MAHRRGRIGEAAARRHLQRAGLRFLAANVRTPRGELDLVFRDGECLVFVEVKARSDRSWTRPSAAVNARKRRALSRAAWDYLRWAHHPRAKLRFDIVEVVLEGDRVQQVRHLPDAFALAGPSRYG
ncbi:MAG: YraN family protein [Verrucomicrobiales bacterium]|nr:YraN family protein [Verrucomicrobiales bacterium]